MTTIALFSRDGGLVGFEAKGHSGHGEAGTDIVCSAVSALTTAAANGITEILHLPAIIQTADGWLYVMLEEMCIRDRPSTCPAGCIYVLGTQ